MAIQPAPMGESYKYRVNEYNNRAIERKPNKRGGRWKTYQIYTTPENATKALLSLQKDEDEE